jgi:hypothetical protein
VLKARFERRARPRTRPWRKSCPRGESPPPAETSWRSQVTNFIYIFCVDSSPQGCRHRSKRNRSFFDNRVRI